MRLVVVVVVVVIVVVVVEILILILSCPAGFGIMAGLTSVITQSYEGASNNGVEGLISGFGKGVIGTVTKPALGILDFATGAAATIRDGSRGGGAGGNSVVRPIRVCHGPGWFDLKKRRNLNGQS